MSEQLQAVSGGPGRVGHPELEELAALIDGQCGAADANRLRAHLASCAECYEVFSETLHLQEDLREEEAPGLGLDPFPFETRPKVWPHWFSTAAAAAVENRPRVWPRWVATAVAAAVVLGVGLGLWRTFGGTPDLSATRLTAPLVGHVADLDKSTWGERMRGGGAHEENQFRLGVEMLNLQVALESGDRLTAESAVAAIYGCLESMDFPEPGAKGFYQKLRVDLGGGKKPQDLSHEAARESDILRHSPSESEIELGMWAAAGRLAAIHQVPSFFQGKQAKYLLGQLQSEKDADLPPEVMTALESVEEASSKDNLSAKDYRNLRTALEQILNHYYRQGQPSGL